MPAVLDRFLTRPEVRGRHEILVQAPAELVFEVAYNFDVQSIRMVRAIFRLRALVLGGKARGKGWPGGLVVGAMAMGWGCLLEEPGHCFVAGAVCQPWQADVVFSPIRPEEFAVYAEPNQVKICWSLEAEALGPELTRFATETRAAATDEASRARFRRYWRVFGIGAVATRKLLLPAMRREAERRWRADRAVAGA
jgi:hypothetical protein